MNFLTPLAHAVTISTAIPGTSATTTGAIGGIIANFYQFALFIGGVLALGAIVWGGVKYTWAAGNPSQQSEGKEWIKAALYGLLLLAGAYLILNTINPNLLQLDLPTLDKIPSVTGLRGTCAPQCDPQTEACLLVNGAYTCQKLNVNCTGQCGVPNGTCAGTCSTPGAICTPVTIGNAQRFICQVKPVATSSSGCKNPNFPGGRICQPGPACTLVGCNLPPAGPFPGSPCQHFTAPGCPGM